jgi:hypothetical protein
MSETSGTSGIWETVGSAYELLRSLVTGVLVLAFVLGWTGFWAAVARIHYLDGDWIGMLASAALSLGLMLSLIVWGFSVGGIRTRLGDIDVSAPSSKASTSRD